MSQLTAREKRILHEMTDTQGKIIKLQSRLGFDLDYQASDNGEAPEGADN